MKATMVFDGGIRGNPGGKTSYGCVLYLEDQSEVEDFGILEKTGGTNNTAELGAMIKGMALAINEGVTNLKVVSDSRLAINLARGNWNTEKEHLRNLLFEVRDSEEYFDKIMYVWRPRNNALCRRADSLAAKAFGDKGSKTTDLLP